ncbi:MAG: repressor LexA [Candidatus Pacebacteria bacterium]|nr:repressor LexA [Candidatus Paceibacterota bacterium]
MHTALSEKDKKAFTFIRNRIIHFGKSPSLREINTVTEDKSPRSASLVINRLIHAGLIRKIEDKILLTSNIDQLQDSVTTVKVPLVGSVPCGSPMLAEENITAYISVSTALAKPGSKYFLLRAVGDSMNLADINDGDILLVRQQSMAENNQRVVALIDDEATVKILERKNEYVILRPKSSNKEHKPIVLTDNCKILGVVISVLPSDLH